MKIGKEQIKFSFVYETDYTNDVGGITDLVVEDGNGEQISIVSALGALELVKDLILRGSH